MPTPKLVIVTSYSFNDEPVINNRITSIIEKLASSGWDISVICTQAQSFIQYPYFLNNKVKIVPLSIKKYDQNNFLTRGINELKNSIKLLKLARKNSPDVIFLTVPSIFLLLFPLFKMKPFIIVDVRDLVWEYLGQSSLSKRLIKYMLKQAAHFSFRFANLITTSNVTQYNYIKKKIPNKQMMLVSNGIGSRKFNELRMITSKETSNPECFNIAYIGNVGLAQDLTTLVRSIAGLKQFKLHIIGCGTDIQRVKDEANNLNADNVFFYGRLSWKEIVEWYAKTDILYAQLTSRYHTAIPSKIYEYLASGLPIIYGGYGAARELLMHFSNVYTINPCKEEELKEVLCSIIKNGLPDRSSENIDKIERNFLREIYTECFDKKILELLEEHHGRTQ